MGRPLVTKCVMVMTAKVSTNCETRVEPLFRSQRWRPCVSFFQK